MASEICFGCTREVSAGRVDAVVYCGRTSHYDRPFEPGKIVLTALAQVEHTERQVICGKCVRRALVADSRDDVLMILIPFLYLGLLVVLDYLLSPPNDVLALLALPLVFIGSLSVLAGLIRLCINAFRLLSSNGRDRALRVILRQRGGQAEMWTRSEWSANAFPDEGSIQ